MWTAASVIVEAYLILIEFYFHFFRLHKDLFLVEDITI